MKEWIAILKVRREVFMHAYSAYLFTRRLNIVSIPLFREFIIEIKKGNSNYFLDKKEFESKEKYAFRKMLNNLAWFDKLHKIHFKNAKNLFKVSRAIYKMNMPQYSDEKLIKLYERFWKANQEAILPGIVPFIIEIKDHLLSTHLKKYLSQQIKRKGLKYGVEEVYAILSTPTEESIERKEEQNILKIANKLKNTIRDKRTKKEIEKRINRIAGKEIEEHVEKFGWIGYEYKGPAWNKKMIIERLVDLISQDIDVQKMVKKMERTPLRIKKMQEHYTRTIGIDKKHQLLFEQARKIISIKAFRKDAMFYGYYATESLLREMGKRAGLNLEQMRVISPFEMRDAILKRKFSRKELNERLKYTVGDFTQKGEKWLTGKKARKFMEKINIKKEKKRKTKFLSGLCAYPGKVRGVAKIIEDPKEMKKMKKGDILVAYQTDPNILPAMMKASAIVTDLNGVTCHAALISKALGIPCVMGTKIATSILKDGKFVEVDANNGVVRIIKSR